MENPLNPPAGWNCSNFEQFNFGGPEAADVFHKTDVPSWHPYLSTIWNGTCDEGQLTKDGLNDAIKHGSVSRQSQRFPDAQNYIVMISNLALGAAGLLGTVQQEARLPEESEHGRDLRAHVGGDADDASRQRAPCWDGPVFGEEPEGLPRVNSALAGTYSCYTLVHQ